MPYQSYITDELFESLYKDITSLEQASSVLAQQSRDVCGEGHLEAIKFFKKLSDLYDRFNEVKKLYNETYDSMSRDKIPELMRESGVKTVTVDDVGRVTVSYRFSCSIIEKETGYKWLRDNGLGDIITETVNSSTLSATAKNLLESEGRELPSDVFKTGTSPYTSITAIKSTKKAP